MFLKLQFVKKKFFLKDSFRISRENKKILNLIIIKLTENDKCGFAECVPYKRYGESQKKIFSYLTNNQSKILKLIRHNKLEKIKYLFDDTFLVKKLIIPLEYLNAFRFYIIEDSKFVRTLLANNTTLATFLIGELAEEYKKMLNE